jgi:glycerophosphoryl diester phosphodiesterase
MLGKIRSRLSRMAALACIAAAALPAQAFDLQAHRGGRGLRPENTLASFENALRMGVTTLELDIAITADGVPVISHDAALNPDITRDAQGQWLKERGPLIRTLSLAQVQSYDVGRINPASRYARAPEAFVETLLAVIRQAGMTQRVMVQSFDWRSLELLHGLEPGLRTMYLSSESSGFNTVKDGSWTAGHRLDDHGGSVPRLVRASAGKAAGVIWAPNFNNLSAALLKEAQALGLQVIPWTVNQKTQMERLIEWGVDGLITDYPDRLRELMGQRGMALPQGVN